MKSFDDDLTDACKSRFREALAESELDAFVAVTQANVAQITGYRSVSAQLFGGSPMRAVLTGDRSILVAPCADSGPALEDGVEAGDFVPYGRFFFTSTNDHPASRMADRFPDLSGAMTEALRIAGIRRGRVGVDVAEDDPMVREAIMTVAPEVEVVSSQDWALKVRAQKLEGELERLRQAARLAEEGIEAALRVAGHGITERELAAEVASTMAKGGGIPRFIVASTGERSALADVHPTDREWKPGELLRFDVGCTVDGYWSDIGRTAVLGEPNQTQTTRYDAILAGEEEELSAVRPGVQAQALFELAVRSVELNGLRPYRRQHCGHGIGAEVYEPPIVRPGEGTELKPGMTFCLETPFYELGWGGMMVEDTVVVREDGCEQLTTIDRGLRVVPI